MMSMRRQRVGTRLLATLGALALASAATACSQIEEAPDEPETTYVSVSWAEGPTTIEELTALADVVVVGTVVEIGGGGEVDNDAGAEISYTDLVVEVERTILGTTAGKITVRQTGDGDTFVVQDDPLMEIGTEHVLFLTEYAPGEFRINGRPSGRFITDDDAITPLDSTSILPEEIPSDFAELTESVDAAATS